MSAKAYTGIGFGAVVALAIAAAFVGNPPVVTAVTQNTDLYVQCSTGSDVGNNCTSSAAPCATLQYAVNQIPKIIRSRTVLHPQKLPDGGDDTCFVLAAPDGGWAGFPTVQAGTEVDGFTVDLGLNSDAGFVIDGDIRQLLTLTTVTSFTAATSTTLPKINVTAAGWTVSAFKGGILRMFSGPAFNANFSNSNNEYPIIDNDATSITFVAAGLSSDATTTFDIVKPTVHLSDATAAFPNVSPLGLPALALKADVGPDIVGGTQAALITVSHLDFLLHTTAGIIVQNSSGIQIASNTFTQAAGNSVFVSIRNAGETRVVSNYMGQNGGTGFRGVQCFERSWCSVYGNAVIGGATGVAMTGAGGVVSLLFNYVESSVAAVSTSSGSSFNASLNFLNASAGTGYNVVNQGVIASTSGDVQYGSPASFAIVDSGNQIRFSSATTTTAANFISLDNGSTFVTKAAIEAGGNKTLFNASTLGLAKEQ